MLLARLRRRYYTHALPQMFRYTPHARRRLSPATLLLTLSASEVAPRVHIFLHPQTKHPRIPSHSPHTHVYFCHFLNSYRLFRCGDLYLIATRPITLSTSCGWSLPECDKKIWACSACLQGCTERKRDLDAVLLIVHRMTDATAWSGHPIASMACICRDQLGNSCIT